MTHNLPQIPISVDSSAPLRLSPPPITPPLPYFSTHSPPKKKRRTKLVKLETLTPARPKKPDPNAPKITRPCTECGKTFWSWKALFGHMRCHPERSWRGINPPGSRKRSCEMSGVEHEIANCLLMLTNGPGLGNQNEGNVVSSNPNPNLDYNEIINCFGDGFGFKSSSCKKVFGSKHALGWHRASHKNVKSRFADVADEGGAESLGHKCGICSRVFVSGQALGGHMRCHFEKGGLSCLDLNLPAPKDDNDFTTGPFSCFSLDLRLGI